MIPYDLQQIDGLYRGVSYRGYLQYHDIVLWQNLYIVTSLSEIVENLWWYDISNLQA